MWKIRVPKLKTIFNSLEMIVVIQKTALAIVLALFACSTMNAQEVTNRQVAAGVVQVGKDVKAISDALALQKTNLEAQLAEERKQTAALVALEAGDAKRHKALLAALTTMETNIGKKVDANGSSISTSMNQMENRLKSAMSSVSSGADPNLEANLKTAIAQAVAGIKIPSGGGTGLTREEIKQTIASAVSGLKSSSGGSDNGGSSVLSEQSQVARRQVLPRGISPVKVRNIGPTRVQRCAYQSGLYVQVDGKYYCVNSRTYTPNEYFDCEGKLFVNGVFKGYHCNE